MKYAEYVLPIWFIIAGCSLALLGCFLVIDTYKSNKWTEKNLHMLRAAQGIEKP